MASRFTGSPFLNSGPGSAFTVMTTTGSLWRLAFWAP